MVVTINGERHQLDRGATIVSVLEQLDFEAEGRGLAVAVDGEVVPRGTWAWTVLTEGMRVEVVAAVQGG